MATSQTFGYAARGGGHAAAVRARPRTPDARRLVFLRPGWAKSGWSPHRRETGHTAHTFPEEAVCAARPVRSRAGADLIARCRQGQGRAPFLGDPAANLQSAAAPDNDPGLRHGDEAIFAYQPGAAACRLSKPTSWSMASSCSARRGRLSARGFLVSGAGRGRYADLDAGAILPAMVCRDGQDSCQLPLLQGRQPCRPLTRRLPPPECSISPSTAGAVSKGRGSAGPRPRRCSSGLRGQGLHLGTKEAAGCAEGDCGACTVALVDRNAAGQPTYRAVNSCIALLPMFAGREVVTVEGLARMVRRLDHPGKLHPVQQAMVEHYGSQCGYCTPGFVVSMFEAYYRDGCQEPWQISDQLCGNLCRCTGYRPIRDAAAAALALAQSSGLAPARMTPFASATPPQQRLARSRRTPPSTTPRATENSSARRRSRRCSRNSPPIPAPS